MDLRPCRRKGCPNLLQYDALAQKKYCSPACKQRAYRQRKADELKGKPQ